MSPKNEELFCDCEMARARIRRFFLAFALAVSVELDDSLEVVEAVDESVEVEVDVSVVVEAAESVEPDESAGVVVESPAPASVGVNVPAGWRVPTTDPFDEELVEDEVEEFEPAF
jgi:hypothetical protein